LFLAETWAQKEGTATDTAPRILASGINGHQGSGADFLSPSLMFCSAHAELNLTFPRRQSTAAVILAVVNVEGLDPFEAGVGQIVAAFEAAGAGEGNLMELAFAAGGRLSREIDGNSEIARAMVDFLGAMIASGNPKFVELALEAQRTLLGESDTESLGQIFQSRLHWSSLVDSAVPSRYQRAYDSALEGI
jgi:hypothetical protein